MKKGNVFSLILICTKFEKCGREDIGAQRLEIRVVQSGDKKKNFSYTLGCSRIEGFVARRNGILEISSGVEDSGGLKWQLVLAHVIAWVGIYFCVIRGVKSVGKVNP